MPGLECVGEADLRAFLLGQLPERVAQAVTEHLEICPRCEAAVQLLDQKTDGVIRALRRAARPGDSGTVSLPNRNAPTVVEAALGPCRATSGATRCWGSWAVAA